MLIELQPQDDHGDLPRITAAVHTPHAELELTAWGPDDPDDDAPSYRDPEATPTDWIRLSRSAWAQLVNLFCLRYPDEAQRILTKAQGWTPRAKETTHADPA